MSIVNDVLIYFWKVMITDIILRTTNNLLLLSLRVLVMYSKYMVMDPSYQELGFENSLMHNLDLILMLIYIFDMIS
jgi:hypothetical protein